MSNSAPACEAAPRTTDSDRATATLSEVDIRSKLWSRPQRPPNYGAEHAALAVLAKEMADNPRNMLQKLVELALELCNADTAGISLLEGELFRWEAVAGVFASSRNGTMPRDASPCGVCIERNTTQLMYLADRCFPALRAEPRFVEALLIPFHDHGDPVGTVWIVTHNFERKFDREDERVVHTLAQFASAGWQLWKACESAAEASRYKDEFMAMLGHELRNPLAAIVSANQVLDKVGAKDSVVMQAVEVVGRQARHLAKIADDLVDLSRISRGKLEIHREPTELRTVLTNAVEATRVQIEDRKHRLWIRSPAQPISILGDAVRLTQMLSNLLDNAAKYTPDGGDISVAAGLADNHVCITVSDTGIGIQRDRFQSIFDLFTQLGEPAATAGRGLGLGLALVRTLAKLHGGSVEVASEGPGKGSRFTIRLPILTVSARDGQPRNGTGPAVTGPALRILVVEDNNDVAETLGMVLGLDGHTVRIAPDGPSALESLRAFEPDAVLLDLGLPGMSGHEVARRVRQESNRKTC